MGKLLKLQLKENLKILLWIWLIPLALSTGFILLNRNVDNTLTQVGLAISIFLLFFGLGASLIIVIYQDYQRFFGKEAIFYQSLPVAPGANVWSRFFSYFVSIILIVFVLFFDFWIISIASGSISLFEVKDVFQTIVSSLRQINFVNVITIVVLYISLSITFIHQIIFCMNFGTQKYFKSMGIFGPILMFILVTILLQVLTFLSFYLIPESVETYFVEVSHINSSDINNVLNIQRPIFYLISGVNILLSVIYASISTYIQNKKLSVG
ncbi:MAG: hypothetical protein SOW41_08565 [Anaerococcus sp.]|nr:hypothetical protein [Peptoniphilaceae bacterium]MDY3056090.1 hypothetical protein [Anaerococcus sp.]